MEERSRLTKLCELVRWLSPWQMCSSQEAVLSISPSFMKVVPDGAGFVKWDVKEC